MNDRQTKTLHVVAAVIIRNGKVLCLQKGSSKYDYLSFKYEFPGGKIEAGESEVTALAREIREELKIDIDVHEKLLSVDHEYPDFRISLHAYQCSSRADAIGLTEHINYQWLSVDELPDLDWAAADIPIVKELKAGLST